MEDDNLCEICLESFNTTNKVPKILDCCGKVFCLKCLNDIYVKNKNKILCPICRKQIAKKPSDLKIDKEFFEPKTICPACHKAVKSQELKIKILRNSTVIICSNCPNSYDNYSLKDYLLNLIEEMDYMNNKFCNFNKQMLDGSIDYQIDTFIDSLIDQLKIGIKAKLKQRVTDNINQSLKLNSIQSHNFFNQLEDFKKFHDRLKPYKSKEIKNTDYVAIKSAVDFYINNSDSIKNNGMILSKTFNSFNGNSLISVDSCKISIEDIENFLCNFIKIEGELSDMKDDKFGKSTGLSFIDNHLVLLNNEIMTLNSDILKKDTEIRKLQIQVNNENINRISYNNKYSPKILLVQSFGFEYTPGNRIINNSEFNLINNNTNTSHPFSFDSVEKDLFTIYDFKYPDLKYPDFNK